MTVSFSELDDFIDSVFAELKAGAPLWRPHPENIPQQLAYNCDADELFYGGAAGGGKTDLLLGLASTRHHRSIIFRRTFPAMRAIIERSREILNPMSRTHSRDSYNESLHIWRLSTGQMIEFGSIQYEKDVTNYNGRPHDFYGWDELPEFSEFQFRYVNAWNRSTRPGQRCRVVGAGNPPTTAEGEWVIYYWGPWLDSQHPNPAKPGDLRWFATIDGKDIEVEDGTPFEHKGELIQPRSRTFIPARLSDNPFLSNTGYKGILQGLPEPLRSQLLYGNFGASVQDNAWQVIPTAWVLAAQQRWQETEKPQARLRAVGVDVAHGGKDETVIAKLYGNWIDELIVYPGADTPEGEDTARYVIQSMEANAPIYIDAIGYGASAYERLKDKPSLESYGVNVGKASDKTDRTGAYQFFNIRSEIFWRLREALDPENGEGLMLPPDRQLRTDLCAPRYSVTGGKIKVESKEDIIKRIGRSPDRGDAVALAWYPANNPISVATTRHRNPHRSRR